MYEKSIIIIIGVLLIASISFNIYLYKNDNTITGQVIAEDFLEKKALLDAQILVWAINENNPNEMFFDYWLYNYGNIEATNIQVRCKLFDENGNIRVNVLDYSGNLASRSENLKEIMTTKPEMGEEELFNSICYVESCTNCEILYKRIPTLIESFE